MKPYIAAVLSLLAISAYAENAPKPQFEVATVRPASEDTRLESFVPTLNAAPGSTLRIVNRQLRELIMLAWSVGGRQLAGPQWLINPPGFNSGDVPRFDVVAKVPTDAKADQVPLMLQSLLEDRFGVRVHREQRQINVYALLPDKGGLTIKPLPAGTNAQSGCARSMFGDDGITHATCANMSVPQFALQLPTLAPAYFPDGPVVDKTGLTGNYDFPLAWITQQQRLAGEEGPSMTEAIDKLGLHLERQKSDADVVVVDQAQPGPSAN
jgi:uncharacterized protein (TIGR03435 family)